MQIVNLPFKFQNIIGQIYMWAFLLLLYFIEAFTYEYTKTYPGVACILIEHAWILYKLYDQSLF